MAAPKGHPRYGGRQKGSISKKTREILDICAKHNFDPIEAMIVLSKEPRCTVDQKTALYAEIAPYIYPKKATAVQVTGQVDLNLMEQVKQLEALPEEKLIELLKDEYKRLPDEHKD